MCVCVCVNGSAHSSRRWSPGRGNKEEDVLFAFSLRKGKAGERRKMPKPVRLTSGERIQIKMYEGEVNVQVMF